MKKLNPTKHRVFLSLVCSSDTEEPQLLLQLAPNWNLSTKIWQSFLFSQDYQPFYDVMQKGIENLEFVPGVNFEIIDSLKNNSTKYMLIFDNPCE